MHFLFTALGSYGDVHPMVGLGEELVNRGHRVSLVTNPHFASLVESAGLELIALGTEEEYLQLVRHPDLWHPRRGQVLVFRFGCVQMLRPLYERMVKHFVPGETVFGAHGLDLSSRIAAEKFGAPIACINFAPAAFLSAYRSNRMPFGLWGDRVPRWLKRGQFWFANQFLLDPLLGPEVNRLRAELGLAPLRHLISSWWQVADLVLGLFPDWFAAPQPDWPERLVLAGFPLWDASNQCELSGDLRRFLEDGERPIVFTPGSAHADAPQFFVSAVEGCQQLGRRGILLTKFPDQLPRRLPTNVRHFGFVPLSHLLPRAAAFVHHGGIGSCAQGLAAGVPHLVCPLAFDQFDNSLRLARLGVSAEIPFARTSGVNFAAALDRLLNSHEVESQCRRFAGLCDGSAAIARACDALEALAPVAVAR
jgi:UDP:flavonoid glycosyltransferase YjiC (YdhE family)